MGERPLGRMKDMFLLVLSYSLGPMICTGSRARRSRRTARFGVPTRANNAMRFKLKVSFPKPLKGDPRASVSPFCQSPKR